MIVNLRLISKFTRKNFRLLFFNQLFFIMRYLFIISKLTYFAFFIYFLDKDTFHTELSLLFFKFIDIL